MFINLYESLLKGKPVYALIFIRICEAMLTALTGRLVQQQREVSLKGTVNVFT